MRRWKFPGARLDWRASPPARLMKGPGPRGEPAPPKARRLPGALGWILLVALLAVVAFVFFRQNGFINSSGVQPYPY